MSQTKPLKFDNEQIKSVSLSKRGRYLERLLEHFRGRWKKEYLTGIREYQKLKTKAPGRSILLGDIVHIYQDKMSKLLWHLGRVVKLFPGRDGIVRSAEVLTLDPSNRVTRLKHPIEKLYPLEVRSEAELEQEKSNEVLIKPVMDENVPDLVIGE